MDVDDEQRRFSNARREIPKSVRSAAAASVAVLVLKGEKRRIRPKTVVRMRVAPLKVRQIRNSLC